MAICTPIIVIPEQEGVESHLQIVVKPNSETVTVLELFPYRGDEGEFFPTHLVNSLFEAPVRIHELVKELQDAELIKLDAYDACKCIVHLHHLLDEEPVICQSLSTALRVAKTIANNP